MKIIEITEHDEEICCDRSWSLKVDGKTEISVWDLSECPEDGTLSKGLNFVYSTVDLIKRAYEVGKRGEEIEFKYIED